MEEKMIIPTDPMKEQIRCLVANVYDLQKMRISAGNRIVSSFYLSHGIDPKVKLENNDEDSQKMLQKLKKEYKNITEGAVAQGCTTNKMIKNLTESKDKDMKLTYIRNDMDYRLISSYMLLISSEDEAIKVLDKYVKQHPMWNAFFEGVKGCGTLMSAVCIAYLDPYKARHVSSFFKYCGLDTVQDRDENGNILFRSVDDPTKLLREKKFYISLDGDILDVNSAKITDEFDDMGNPLFKTSTGVLCTEKVVTQKVSKIIDGEEVEVEETVFVDTKTGEDFVGTVFISEHGRRMGDTEMFEYTTKDGKKALKRGITYNPVLKTKLMGVLTGCLMKAKDPIYTEIYYDYRARLDKNKRYTEASNGHKNLMAQRYMVKQFLRNLWTTWRELEGLPVDNPYEVEKLGNKPHKYNEYQCEVAKKYMN